MHHFKTSCGEFRQVLGPRSITRREGFRFHFVCVWESVMFQAWSSLSAATKTCSDTNPTLLSPLYVSAICLLSWWMQQTLDSHTDILYVAMAALSIACLRFPLTEQLHKLLLLVDGCRGPAPLEVKKPQLCPLSCRWWLSSASGSV